MSNVIELVSTRKGSFEEHLMKTKRVLQWRPRQTIEALLR